MNADNSADNACLPLKEGSVFAERFDLHSIIGQGAMAVVYKARDVLLDRFVALKILNVVGSQDIYLRRFKEEAKAGSRLVHPNIVQILNFGIANGARPYIAMELIEGITLKQVFSEEKRFDNTRIAEVFLPVSAAIAYAHQNGVIHRDLKPENIMLGKNPDSGESFVKILDFGIAKIIDEESQASSRLTVGVAGTPHYMSPEQCRGELVAPSSDVYSLACILYEALSGSPPFSKESAYEQMYAHISVPAPRIVLSADQLVSQSVIDLVMNSLQKDGKLRPQSGLQFHDGLQSALESKRYAKAAGTRLSYLRWVFCVGLLVFLFCSIYFLSATQQKKMRVTAPVEQEIQKNSELRRHKRVGEVAKDSIKKLMDEGSYVEAERTARQFLASKLASGNDKQVVTAYELLSNALFKQKRFEEAKSVLEQALQRFPSFASNRRIDLLILLSNLYKDNGDVEQSLSIRRKMLLDIETASIGNVHYTLACQYLWFGDMLREQGRDAEARSAYKKSLQNFDSSESLRRHSYAVTCAIAYYCLCKKAGEEEQGEIELRKTCKMLCMPYKDVGTEMLRTWTAQHKIQLAPTSNVALEAASEALAAFGDLLILNGRPADALAAYKLALLEAPGVSAEKRQVVVEHSENKIRELVKAGGLGKETLPWSVPPDLKQ